MVELQIFIFKYNFDFIMLQETFHEKEKIPLINGYKSIGISRKKGAGGVIIYYNKRIKIIPIYSICNDEITNLEIIGLTTKIADRDYNLYNVYVPPSAKNSDLEILYKLETENTIIGGDFNAHSEKWSLLKQNSRGLFMENFVKNRYNILNKDKIATCYQTNKNPSTPDLIITDQYMATNNRFTCEVANSSLGSDHKPLICTFETEKTKPNVIIRYSTKNLDISEYTKSLNIFRLKHFSKKKTSWEGTYESFVSIVKYSWEQSCKPTIITSNKHPKPSPWFNQELRQILKNKNRARKNLNVKPSMKNKKKYQEAKLFAKQSVLEAKNKFWKTIGQQRTPDTINRLLRNSRNNYPEQEVQNNGTRLMSYSQISNDFAKSLQSITKKVKTKLTKPKTEIYQSQQRILDDNPTRDEIACIIKKMNVKKANGTDKISNSMLKFGGDPIIKMLCHLFKKFWNTQKYPNEWNLGNMILIPKSKAKIIGLSDLRPISLLSNISKIFEKLILQRLIKTNLANTLTSRQQTGFKNGKSTDWNLAILADKIHNARTKNKTISIVFLDLTKAYDMVNRPALSKKLTKFFEKSKIMSYLNFFLNKRMYTITYKNITSKEFELKLGLPQGSALSPLLFNIYSENITNMKNVYGYADDLIFIHKTNNHNDRTAMKTNLKKLIRLIKQTGLEINTSKTKVLTIGNSHKTNLKIDGKKIENVDNFKYLGVWFDKNNSFNTNTISIINKTNKKAGAIRYLFSRISGCSSETGIEIYKSHIRPLMEYGSAVWSEISKYNSKKLESIQHKILCWIIGTHPRAAIKDVLKLAQINDLKTRREIQLISRWIKSLTECEHIDIFNHKTDKSKVSLSEKVKIIIKKYRLDQNSLKYENLTNIKTKMLNYWKERSEEDEYRISNEAKLTVEILKSKLIGIKRKGTAEKYINISRKKQCLMNQARLGTIPLNYFRSRTTKQTKIDCTNLECKAKESRIHFLFYCPLYSQLRKQYLGSNKVKNKRRQINILSNVYMEYSLMNFMNKAMKIRENYISKNK